jgi:hypothetical protein
VEDKAPAHLVIGERMVDPGRGRRFQDHGSPAVRVVFPGVTEVARSITQRSAATEEHDLATRGVVGQARTETSGGTLGRGDHRPGGPIELPRVVEIIVVQAVFGVRPAEEYGPGPRGVVDHGVSGSNGGYRLRGNGLPGGSVELPRVGSVASFTPAAKEHRPLPSGIVRHGRALAPRG